MKIDIVEVFLNIYKKEFFVGKLLYKEKVIYFEYDKVFLQSGIEISPYKLPLKSGVFTCDDNVFEGLFGVFGDSLPDGWGRLLLDRYFLKHDIKYSDITPLDRLGYIGKYGIGALSYHPFTDGITSDIQDIVLDNLHEKSLKILKEDSMEGVERFLELGCSSAGARPKAMIQINNKNETISGSQMLQYGYEHYIVKFASSNDSVDIGKIEYIYSMMAKDANIGMPETKLLKGTTGSYFAIKRFDRVKDERVHIHSVAGLTHSDFRFPVLDYDDLLSLTLHLTKDVNELYKMYRLACFNLFSHNRDDHAKNFSFLLDENYTWKLSPAYDLTFSYGPGGEHSTTYLGEGKNPSQEHLLRLAKIHNIKNAKEIISEVKLSLCKFKEYAKEFNLNNQSINLIVNSITQIGKL
ncbi:MAG: type II toxin-antitoxin system HipA family toxin [Epsilonproteobacteria bacterium]|nr:MAG: type II toxin-antitoxin system HipA family toxin [Campylobacterota bacterium]